MRELTLEGSTAGPDRGAVYFQGRPICDDDHIPANVWDINDATVVCKMLGFNTATKSHHDSPFGNIPPAGIPFTLSGFNCTGSETHILDCPHDATVSPHCGTNGNTSGTS